MDEAFETFLTLCAHPYIGSAAGDARPVIVVSTMRQEIVWANAAGADICGLESAHELAAPPLPRTRRLARDLSRQVRFSGQSEARPAMVRLRKGLETIVLSCRIEPIADGNLQPLAHCLILAPAVPSPSRQNPLAAFASFAGGPSASVVDASGVTVAPAEHPPSPAEEMRPVPLGATGLMLLVPPEDAEEGGPSAWSLQGDLEPLAASDLGAKAVRAPAPESGPPAGRANADAAPSRPVRFTWQSDAADRLTYLSPEFSGVLGPTDTIVGRSWFDLTRALDLDPDGAFEAALSERTAWSGTTLMWPQPSLGGRVPVDIAGLAIQDPNRAFRGFRGFGLVRPGDLIDDPTVFENTPAPSDAPADEIATDGPSNETTHQPADDWASAPPHAGNVVRLHGHDAPPSGDLHHLSRPEQEAFRMIAAALGARFEGDEPSPPSMEATALSAPLEKASAIAEPPGYLDADDPMPSAFATVTRAPDTRVLDRLPLALLVSQRDRIVHINAAALKLLGYRTKAEIERSGGLAGVFAEVPAPPGAQDNAILLRSAGGALIPAEVRLHTVPWGEERALLVILRALPAEAQGEEVPMNEDEDGDGEAHPAGPAPAPERQSDEAPDIADLLNAVPDAVFVLEPDGTIAIANAGASSIFRRPTEAFPGMRLDDLLDEDGGGVVHDLMEEISAGAEPTRPRVADDVMGLCRDRGNVPLALSVGLVGTGPRFCAVLRDVARWKTAEARYSEATRAAETANAQKSEMLARISHEIRTPLNAILGFADVMLAEKLGPLGNQRYRDYLRDISISGHHILSLVNDLLDLSKIEAGKLDLSFEPVSVNEIARDCSNLMEPQAESDKVEIRTRLQADLPRILADTRSLRQITLNLLSNAIKFNRSGGVVSLSTFQSDTGAVVLRVSDNGIGMSEDDLAAALEPFRRVAGSNKAGTGLGLPLTKALAEANRADFKIRSEPNRGTVVDITFPAPRVLAA